MLSQDWLLGRWDWKFMEPEIFYHGADESVASTLRLRVTWKSLVGRKKKDSFQLILLYRAECASYLQLTLSKVRIKTSGEKKIPVSKETLNWVSIIIGDFSLFSFQKAVLWHRFWGQGQCSGIFLLSRCLWIPQGICCIPRWTLLQTAFYVGCKSRSLGAAIPQSFSGTQHISAHHSGWCHLDSPGAGISASVERIAPASPQGWEIHHATSKLSEKFLPLGLCLASWDLHPKVQGFIEFNQLIHIAPFCYCDSKPPGRFGYESPSVSHCTYWNDLHYGQPEPIGISMVSLFLNINSPKEFIFLVSIGTTQTYVCVTLTCSDGTWSSLPFYKSRDRNRYFYHIWNFKISPERDFLKSCKIILFQN